MIKLYADTPGIKRWLKRTRPISKREIANYERVKRIMAKEFPEEAPKSNEQFTQELNELLNIK